MGCWSSSEWQFAFDLYHTLGAKAVEGGREAERQRLFVCFLNVLVNNQALSRTGPKTERLAILRAATHETELGDHDFCLSRSHYTRDSAI